MGYKCDVCGAEDAAVFCLTDQAVLCAACDSRVHGASKVAKKHERVTLQKESESATCDICQEHKAIMFCSEDRALICRRCDVMIHTANEFVAKHHRYLLSGVTVGLKPLGGTATDGNTDEGQSRKPYGLRNTTSSHGAESWRNTNDREAWRNTGMQPASTSRAGLSSNTYEGSQPSLINLANSGTAGVLTGASLISNAQEEHDAPCPDAQGTGSPHAAQEAGVSRAFGCWGNEVLGHTGSTDLTLAADLLGMPSLSQGLTAKDVDAAYIFDDEGGLDDNLSALLEVPELDFLQTQEAPVVDKFETETAVPGLNDKKYDERSVPADGVVPDLKRQCV